MQYQLVDAPMILVVDDDDFSAGVLTGLLSKEGFRACRAVNGIEGKRMALELKPDLILLDIRMPEEDGFSTCQKLKDDPATAMIPIIFETAADDIDSKLKGFSLGAVDYITKPFEKSEVLARVRLHLKLHLTHQELVESYIYKLNQLTEAQQFILPKPEDFPLAKFAVYYKPLDAAGGDFYDVLPISDHLFEYVVADVSGHDWGSSHATASLKALLHQNSATVYTIPESVQFINDVLYRILPADKFLSLCFVRLNRLRKRLAFACAGHPPLVVVRSKGEAGSYGTQGDLVGVSPSIQIEAKEISIESGDRFYLYTDGLLEQADSAVASSLTESIEGLVNLCRQYHSCPLEEAVQKIIDHRFDADHQPADDILLMAVEV